MSIIIKKILLMLNLITNLMQFNMHGMPYSSSADNKIIIVSPMQKSIIKMFKNIITIATYLKNWFVLIFKLSYLFGFECENKK